MLREVFIMFSVILILNHALVIFFFNRVKNLLQKVWQ